MGLSPEPLTGPAPALIGTRRGPVEAAVAGKGPAILALHGGMGGHDQSWLLACALLASPGDYRVVAVSRPGYLGTSLDLGRTPQEQADLYAELLDALGIGAAVVIAVSAGGPSALQFALRHPARCRALVLVSTCTGRLAIRPDIMSRLRLMRLFAMLPGLAGLMRRRAARDPEASTRRAIPDADLRARTLSHPQASALLRGLQGTVLDRLGQRLPGTIGDTTLFAELEPSPVEQIAAPILLVHGTADHVVPFSHARDVAERAPHAELMAVEGAEHVALFTHLDAVRERVAHFLASHRLVL